HEVLRQFHREERLTRARRTVEDDLSTTPEQIGDLLEERRRHVDAGGEVLVDGGKGDAGVLRRIQRGNRAVITVTGDYRVKFGKCFGDLDDEALLVQFAPDAAGEGTDRRPHQPVG